MNYPGGKGRLWKNLVSVMPPHDVYIETHLGGGAVMRNKRPARRNIGIDVDASVTSSAAYWDVPGLTLHTGDATEFLRAYEFVGNELVYLDPPYVASTKRYKRYYKHELSDVEHANLLDVVRGLPCAVMISGYSSNLYGEILSSWNSLELVNVTNAGLRKEYVWANFSFSSELHDYRYIGDTFRERERIHRRSKRWVRRLQAMPEVEQKAVLSALLQSVELKAEFFDQFLERIRLERAR